MDWICAIFLVLLFALLIVLSVRGTKVVLRDVHEKISYALVAVNYLVCIAACIVCLYLAYPSCNSSPIGLDRKPLDLASVFGYVFVWWIFSILYGGILGSISSSIAMAVHIAKNGPGKTPKGFISPGFASAMMSGLLAGGIATAFCLLLCVFGASAIFFS